MRFFIALEIADQNRLQLRSIQSKLSKLIPNLRLTDHDKLHLTLAFIGEHPQQLKTELVNIMDKSIDGIKPFQVTPAYIDGFPNIHHPQVIWVGVKGDIDKLLILRERIKDGLITLNLMVDERRFTPHMTIAKTNGVKVNSGVEQQIQKLMSSEFEPINIDSIKLFESIPHHGFHQHNTLAEIKL